METKTIYEKLFELKKKSITLLRDEAAFNYKYADLSQIQDKIAPALEELRLLIFHLTENNQVKTYIVNVDDTKEKIWSEIEIGTIQTTRTWKDNKGVENVEVTSQDPQAVGSIITYYRRYNLLQLLDLKTEDNDGASASPRAKNNAQSNEKTPQAPTTTTTTTKPYITDFIIQTLVQDLKEGKIQVVLPEQFIAHARTKYVVGGWAVPKLEEGFNSVKK